MLKFSYVPSKFAGKKITTAVGSKHFMMQGKDPAIIQENRQNPNNQITPYEQPV